MTCYHIEEMVNLIFIIHGDLGVAGVTADRMITIITSTTFVNEITTISFIIVTTSTMSILIL